MRKGVTLSQLGAQREQGIEHYADAGDRFALEGTTGLVRVDDGSRSGEVFAGQMVIGNQGRHAEARGFGNPIHARNAVVDRNQHVGRKLSRDAHDFG